MHTKLPDARRKVIAGVTPTFPEAERPAAEFCTQNSQYPIRTAGVKQSLTLRRTAGCGVLHTKLPIPKNTENRRVRPAIFFFDPPAGNALKNCAGKQLYSRFSPVPPSESIRKAAARGTFSRSRQRRQLKDNRSGQAKRKFDNTITRRICVTTVPRLGKVSANADGRGGKIVTNEYIKTMIINCFLTIFKLFSL